MTVTTDTPARRRPTLRPVQVVRIEDPGPRLRRVTFGGDSLQGFGPARPGAHIKLFFSEMPADWRPEPGQPRPTARTYTPRSFDAQRNQLVVEFVRHGAGVASDWVEQAQVGDRITVAGPGGGHDFEPGLRRLVLLADESALPAAGMIIDAAPAGCHVTLVAEVEDAADQIVPSRTPRRRTALAASPADKRRTRIAAARRRAIDADRRGHPVVAGMRGRRDARHQGATDD